MYVSLNRTELDDMKKSQLNNFIWNTRRIHWFWSL